MEELKDLRDDKKQLINKHFNLYKANRVYNDLKYG